MNLSSLIGYHRWYKVQCLVHNLAASVLSHVPSNLGRSFTSDWKDHRWRFSPFWGWGVMSVYQRTPAYTTRIPCVYHANTARIPRVYHAYTRKASRIPRVCRAYTTPIPAYTSVYRRIPSIYIYMNTKATVMMLHLFWNDWIVGCHCANLIVTGVVLKRWCALAWAFINANQILRFVSRNGCFLVAQKDWRKRWIPFFAYYDNKNKQNEMRKNSTQRNLQKLSSKFKSSVTLLITRYK